MAHNDMVSAMVMLKQHQRLTEACIEGVLAGKTLSISQRRKTQGQAVHAILRAIERQLNDFRIQQRRSQTGLQRAHGGCPSYGT